METLELSVSDLILCVNLLNKNAAEWDRIEEASSTKGPAKSRANDRRALAQKMRAEVMRRDSLMDPSQFDTM